MRDHIKAALITIAVCVAMAVFVWLCVVTDGLAVLGLIIALIIAGIYTVVYGFVTGRIYDW